MNIKLVKQTNGGDCAHACLAMVMGLYSASDLVPWLGHDGNHNGVVGTYDSEVISVLETAGFSVAYHASAEAHGPEEVWRGRNALKTEQDLQNSLARLGKDHCAIVGVPSLNNDGFHLVVVNDDRIFDPSNEHEYAGMPNSLPVLSVMFIHKNPLPVTLVANGD